MMRRHARFCGLQVLAYALMGNHVHLLVRVSEEAEVPDRELLARAEALYGRSGPLTALLREEMKRAGPIDADLRQGLLERMGDLSAFMKELKQRFSRWYNRRFKLLPDQRW